MRWASSTLLVVGAAASLLAGAPGCTARRLGPDGSGRDAAVGIAPAGRDDAGAVRPGGGADAGTGPDARGAVDAGIGADTGGAPDAGAPSPDAGTVPAHGGSRPAGTPVSLAGGCSSDLRVAGPLRGTEGTRPAAGPYVPCRILSGHDYGMVQLSDDGQRVAAVTTSGQILVLDSRALTPLAVLTRARGPYNLVALSPDGAIVAAGSDLDGELDVWRVADQALLRAVDLGATWPTLGGAVAISKDGARVATVAGKDIVIADVATGALRRLPASRLATALFFVDGDRKLAFSGGQFWSAGTGNARVDLIDLEDGAVQTLDQHDDIFGTDLLAASADGSTLLTLGHGELAVWDAATGAKRVLPQPSWQEGTLLVYGLSDDGSEIAASLSDSRGLWFQRRRSSDDTVIEEIPIEATARHWYGWSSRARLLVAEQVGADGMVALATVDLAAAKLQAKGCSGQPAGWPDAFSADGRRLLANHSGQTNGATVFDVATGQTIASGLRDGAAPSDTMTRSSNWRWSPDWQWSAWTTYLVENDMVTKQVHVMPVGSSDERVLLEWQSTNYGESIAFSADSRRLAVVDAPMQLLTVLDVESGALLAQVALSESYPAVLDFTPDGDSLLIRDAKAVRTVRWSDGATLAELATGDDYVATASDGTVVAFGSGEARAYRDGTTLVTMPGIGDFCFGFTPEATLSDDGSTVGLGANCSRSWGLSRAPHVDIRATATGALIQQVTLGTPIVFSRDASMFADGSGLIWCRGDPG